MSWRSVCIRLCRTLQHAPCHQRAGRAPNPQPPRPSVLPVRPLARTTRGPQGTRSAVVYRGPDGDFASNLAGATEAASARGTAPSCVPGLSGRRNSPDRRRRRPASTCSGSGVRRLGRGLLRRECPLPSGDLDSPPPAVDAAYRSCGCLPSDRRYVHAPLPACAERRLAPGRAGDGLGRRRRGRGRFCEGYCTRLPSRSLSSSELS